MDISFTIWRTYLLSCSAMLEHDTGSIFVCYICW